MNKYSISTDEVYLLVWMSTQAQYIINHYCGLSRVNIHYKQAI